MEKDSKNDTQALPLKSPESEAWKAGLFSALTWTGIFSLISGVAMKLHGASLRPKHPDKAEATFVRGVLSALVPNVLFASIFGVSDGFRAKDNTKRDNRQVVLEHENAVLRGQLGQAGEILNQTAAYIQLTQGAAMGPHSEKALADKAAAAEAKHEIK